MKKQYRTIPQDDPAKAWSLVDTVRRTAKKKYITAQFASFFSNLVFAAMTLVAGNGLLCEGVGGGYRNAMQHIPQLLLLWERLSGLYRHLCPNFAVLIVVTALLLYSVCFCVNALLVLLVTAVYHPRPMAFPEEETQAATQKLLGLARDSRRYSLRIDGSNGAMVWSLLFMLAQLVVFTVYVIAELGNVGALMELVTKPAMTLLEPVLTSEMAYYGTQNALFTPSIALFVLGLYFVYAAANRLHMLSVQFLFVYRVPYSFVAQAEYLHIFNGQEADTAADNGPRLLAEALEFERLGAYGKAMQLLAEAAHSGNCDAMEHYARHWLVAGSPDPAKYWLEKYVAQSDSPTSQAVQNLRRLRWRKRVQAAYLPRSTDSM